MHCCSLLAPPVPNTADTLHLRCCTRYRGPEPDCDRIAPLMPYDCLECRPGYRVKAGACEKVGWLQGAGQAGVLPAQQPRFPLPCACGAAKLDSNIRTAHSSFRSAPRLTAAAGCAAPTPQRASAARACRTMRWPAAPASPAPTSIVPYAARRCPIARNARRGGARQQTARACSAPAKAAPRARWTARAAACPARTAITSMRLTRPVYPARWAVERCKRAMQCCCTCPRHACASGQTGGYRLHCMAHAGKTSEDDKSVVLPMPSRHMVGTGSRSRLLHMRVLAS